mmetsp:Transcript_7029/g.9860  ORF Transcript_7029/g.9860 Transcript_7029/m.9860 type:complete len:205 (-) Transcript_7029:248-862(-)
MFNQLIFQQILRKKLQSQIILKIKVLQLLSLEKGKKIKLSCLAKLGIGKEHAKWTPVARSVFRPQPIINFDHQAISALHQRQRLKIIQCAPKGVLGFLSDEDYIPPPDSPGTHLSRIEQQKYIVVKNEAAILDYIEDVTILTRALSSTGKPLIHATVSETNFIFDVEAVGSMPVDEIILCAIYAIKSKCEELKGELGAIEEDVN